MASSNGTFCWVPRNRESNDIDRGCPGCGNRLWHRANGQMLPKAATTVRVPPIIKSSNGELAIGNIAFPASYVFPSSLLAENLPSRYERQAKRKRSNTMSNEVSFLIAFATVFGASEAIKHIQSQARKKEHRSRKNNLIVRCLKSCQYSSMLESRRVVLSGNKVGIVAHPRRSLRPAKIHYRQCSVLTDRHFRICIICSST